MKRCVLQDWVQELSLMQQSVLLTALRGGDGLPKRHCSKYIVRWIRRCVLLSAFEGEVISDPVDGSRGGSFTGPSLKAADIFVLDPARGLAEIRDWVQPMNKLVDQYIESTDELPQHFHAHIRNAVQILGYKHPDEKISEWWVEFYYRICKDTHMNPESVQEMDYRLADNKEQWLAAGDPSSCGRCEAAE